MCVGVVGAEREFAGGGESQDVVANGEGERGGVEGGGCCCRCLRVNRCRLIRRSCRRRSSRCLRGVGVGDVVEVCMWEEPGVLTVVAVVLLLVW